ncbi:unnamed protein product [Litomosoides sigmodontis]|uniref:Uncharacterized protein n=1 Tax=Litomosoides sigmodontis TaxID=42156 RepID=A0A3P6SF87_LITSI|nr:unnamed protein product [Litomosoides sigmodontis]
MTLARPSQPSASSSRCPESPISALKDSNFSSKVLQSVSCAFDVHQFVDRSVRFMASSQHLKAINTRKTLK